MSIETNYENRQVTKDHRSLLIILTILVLISIGMSSYSYYSLNTRINGYEIQVSTLTSSIQSLNTQLSESNAKIVELRATISNNGGGGSLDYTQLYNQTKDSVVLIKSVLPQGTAQGSGFIYDEEGRIVTNNHVIEGADSISVTFLDGTIVDASLVGRDPLSDIAVIKVDRMASFLKPLRLGDSSKLKVGEPVLAIGNPYGLADTLTTGIVSALGREMDSASGFPIVDVIQMDASINPGNSGGPLINMAGEVVGINTAVPSQASTGIGFAVPSNTIKRELPSLVSIGRYDYAYVGIQGTDVSPGVISAMNLSSNTRGILVQSVTLGGPADMGGLKGGTSSATVDGISISIGGDVVIGADGLPMKKFYDLILYIQRSKRPGDTIELSILRNGSALTITSALGTRPTG